MPRWNQRGIFYTNQVISLKAIRIIATAIKILNGNFDDFDLFVFLTLVHKSIIAIPPTKNIISQNKSNAPTFSLLSEFYTVFNTCRFKKAFYNSFAVIFG